MLQETKCRLGRPALRRYDGIGKDLPNTRGDDYGNRDPEETAKNKEGWKLFCDMEKWSRGLKKQKKKDDNNNKRSWMRDFCSYLTHDSHFFFVFFFT